MFKKFFAVILSAFIFNISLLPAFSKADNAVIKDIVIDTKLVSDLDVNKSTKNQIVQFKSIEKYSKNGEVIIPEGTLFNGRIASMKKSRFAYRRAKVQIVVDEMVLPTGEKIKMDGKTQRTKYKGSAFGNVVKGIVCTPLSLAVAAVGGVVIVAEAVTIVGLLLVGPTAGVVGGTLGKMTKGVNCKLEMGEIIPLHLNYVKYVPSAAVNSQTQTTLQTPVQLPDLEKTDNFNELNQNDNSLNSSIRSELKTPSSDAE